MDGSIQFFGKIKSLKLTDKEEAERSLSRAESVRMPVADNEELNMLFRRGELLRASDLGAKKEAEQQAAIDMQNAIEEQQREHRSQKPKERGLIAPIWSREKL